MAPPDATAAAYLQALRRFGIRPGLERMRFLLGRMGDPHLRLRAVHVAGTNGKGSVSRLIAGVLREAGQRVGLFTSPHLQAYGERIQVDGRLLPEEEFSAGLLSLRPLAGEAEALGLEHPTEFELVTALMYRTMAAAGVDWLVQETGLGGLWDSTNVIPAPAAAVITGVDYDHTDRLGGTLVEIARQKAGIVKPGRPVVTGAEGPALRVIAAEAGRLGAPLWRVGRDGCEGACQVIWRPREVGPEGGRFDCGGPGFEHLNLEVGLLGEHQLQNAAIAVAALERLRIDGACRWSEGDLRAGLRQAFWPGRLERVQERPLVLLDGAHNPAGARALASALRTLFRAGDPSGGRRLSLVLGCLADKEWTGILAPLVPLGDRIRITAPPSERAASPSQLANWLEGEGRGLLRPGVRPRIAPDCARAVEEALAEADPDDLVVVAGSLYLIGAVRGRWRPPGD